MTNVSDDDDGAALEARSSALRFLTLIAMVIAQVFYVLNDWMTYDKPGVRKEIARKKRSRERRQKRPGIFRTIAGYRMTIDFRTKTIRVNKRGLLFGGVSEECRFRNIRDCTVDEYLLTSDIHIKVYGSTVSAYYLSKSSARAFVGIVMNEASSHGVALEERDFG